MRIALPMDEPPRSRTRLQVCRSPRRGIPALLPTDGSASKVWRNVTPKPGAAAGTYGVVHAAEADGTRSTETVRVVLTSVPPMRHSR